MKRGILLPIFSLPSEYGIGDFGYEAYEFIDILNKNGIEYWEILPITDGGQYPYSPISYYALNKNYISIDKLVDMGLITKVKKKAKSDRITYDDFKEEMYKEAYKNFKEDKEYVEFCENIEIQRYAEYMYEIGKDSKEYNLFLQFILDKQWKELKEYANKNNVKIIGDLPIYPDYNSCELKYNSRYYDLVDGKMEYVSGASPDYFNSEGQKWGHPLYNFKEIKKENYAYLIKRYIEFINRFDIVRIDHFRAFDTYFKIPINSNAKSGYYVEGPGEEFFDELFKYTTSNRFIVEDLGDIRKETEELRDKYNFTKMKILQYTLNLNTLKDEYDDSNNMVFYTGNHDNNTIIGWFNGLKEIEKDNLKKFLLNNNCYYDKINVALIKYCLKSNARMVIIPVQDILGLDENSRINLPGHEHDGNWSWQLLDFNSFKENIVEFNI